MQRPTYLSKYLFNWETLDVVVSGKSAIDAHSYLGPMKLRENIDDFILGYGIDVHDPIQKAELFGNFQEAIQFIKRYFLKEGNQEGLELSIPHKINLITDVGELFLMANGALNNRKTSYEEGIWASIILKVMHTILHADKDLRYQYFNTIQTQIFDRFYRYLHRDENQQLYLMGADKGNPIYLEDFQTKAKKSRESILIKMLHKAENVAEELFDRVGVRIITKNRIDTLRVMRFLYEHYVFMAQNIKPSRSQNSLIDLKKFKKTHHALVKEAFRVGMSEAEFIQRLEKEAELSTLNTGEILRINKHSSEQYRAVHFTCRQLIKYVNPFMDEFNQLRKMAKQDSGSELAKKVLSMDTSSMARDVRFFYPFEVQITDKESHIKNSQGEASHQEYKRAQLHTAMKRLFKHLIEYKGLNVT